jgi:hypothetical protein
MRSTWAAVVVLCLALTAVAGAQTLPSTPRAMGMGNAVIGVADDGGAWAQNPAGLAALHVRTQGGKDWGNDMILGLGKAQGSDGTGLGLNWSGWNPSRSMGAGAGYNDMGGTKVFGAAFGMAKSGSMFSWGVDVMRLEKNYRDDTVFDVGAMYRVERAGKASTRLGMKIYDIADATDDGPQLGLGVSWAATEDMLVAVDVVDVTSQTNSGPFLNGGVECKVGNEKDWRVRGGLFDDGHGHDLTLGVGVVLAKVRLDLAFMDTDNSSWMAAAGFDF